MSRVSKRLEWNRRVCKKVVARGYADETTKRSDEANVRARKSARNTHGKERRKESVNSLEEGNIPRSYRRLSFGISIVTV